MICGFLGTARFASSAVALQSTGAERRLRQPCDRRRRHRFLVIALNEGARGAREHPDPALPGRPPERIRARAHDARLSCITLSMTLLTAIYCYVWALGRPPRDPHPADGRSHWPGRYHLLWWRGTRTPRAVALVAGLPDRHDRRRARRARALFASAPPKRRITAKSAALMVGRCVTSTPRGRCSLIGALARCPHAQTPRGVSRGTVRR